MMTTKIGSIISDRRVSVLNIKIRLPIINRGARVPMRSETCTSRWKTVVSLDRRTIN